MLKLNRASIGDKAKWNEVGIDVPSFDYDAVASKTTSNPTWVHFGAGNIFRGFVAHAHQKVLDQGLADTGIIAVDSFDFEVIEKVYKPFEDLSMLVLMKADGTYDKKVIGSIVESVTADYSNEVDIKRLEAIFESDSLQMVSFTITEKGYGLTTPDGSYIGVVQSDIEAGPDSPKHTMSIIVSLMYKRYLKGQQPVTLVSMDNCSHNGDKLKKAVLTIAKEWGQQGYVKADFVDYLSDSDKVAYPLSMIDKITPRPSEIVGNLLADAGVEDMSMIKTSKGSFMAPFVNAEVCEYLVIEDTFTNGRPALDKAGVIFTDRDTVNNVETMKVTTCLNPLHTALATTGCVLGYTLIADMMQDSAIVNFVKTIGYDEGLKVVVNPGIIDPKSFIDEVVNERLVNPNIPDSPQRIATDTSQKVGIRFGETIKSYVKSDELDASSLTAIPLAIAMWTRYLLGVDDNGDKFELSSDPLLETLQSGLSTIEFGTRSTEGLSSILSNDRLFGINLYEAGLGDKIEAMFAELNAGKGSVRETLTRHFG